MPEGYGLSVMTQEQFDEQAPNDKLQENSNNKNNIACLARRCVFGDDNDNDK
jgi:hypothetical protein